MQGKTKQYYFWTPSLSFNDIDNNVLIKKAHSIVADQNARGLLVTAITTDDWRIMFIQHKELPIYNAISPWGIPETQSWSQDVENFGENR